MKTEFRRLPLLFFLVTSIVTAQEIHEVRIKEISEVANYPLRNASATVVSLNESTISAEISSRIVEIPVRVGDLVKQNAPLVYLDCYDYELQRERSTAALESLKSRKQWAEKRLQRTQILISEESVSEEELDDRRLDVSVLENDLQAAQAVLSQAVKNVNRCLIKSPINAVVTARHGALGEFASSGTPLVQLVDIENIEVSAQVSSSEIKLINSAKTIQFSFAEKLYPVQVRAVLPVVNTETRNHEIRLLFTEQQASAGAAGKLVWKDSRPHISADFIVERNGYLGVFIAMDGKAKFYPLADARPGRITPVDLPVDTLLIVEGHYSLRDDSVLKVIK